MTPAERPDMTDVRGMADAVASVERAAAAREGILLVGPPGVGKTMIARRIPGILPPLTELGQAWIRAEYDGINMTLPVSRPVERPFRAPHHTVSQAALVGVERMSARFWTGLKTYRTETISRAGEVQLARFGVLFLDELPEFPRSAIEALRVKLASLAHPPLIVASALPCPCGWMGYSQRECICTDAQFSSYNRRVCEFTEALKLCHGIPVPPVALHDLRHAQPGEPSASIAARVAAAWGAR